jgi:putative pyruvate formate lyase activating enzyme
MSLEPTREAIEKAYALASPCRICPRLCEVDRPGDEEGYCGIGDTPLVASAGPHYGEEPCLVGRGGSGTIFLSGCNLLCEFCQNAGISHGAQGRPADPTEIATMMLSLQRRGCDNINFVTPSHVVPWLMDAVRRARMDELNVPIVYNCGGYDRVETLEMLEGTVDIYMPDAKFWDAEPSKRYCDAPDYPERMRESLKEMHRQVGDLRVVNGVARSGLLVRHLVMPDEVAGSKNVLDFLANEVSENTAVNVMDQYRPCYRASEYPEIARRPTSAEYAEVRDHARGLGLRLG